MAITLVSNVPPKKKDAPVILPRGTWQIGPVQAPVAQKSTTAVAPDRRSYRSNVGGLTSWYPEDQAHGVAQLAGMQQPQSRQAIPVSVDPSITQWGGLANMGKDPWIRMPEAARLDYKHNAMAHELGHIAVPRGHDLASSATRVLQSMPQHLLNRLPAHLRGQYDGRTELDGFEFPSTALEAVRSGAFPIVAGKGVIEDPNQRAFPHPKFHPQGIDAGMDQMIEYLANPRQTINSSSEVPALFQVAKEYKPLRDWLKKLYQSYGATQRPVGIDNNRFVINDSEVA